MSGFASLPSVFVLAFLFSVCAAQDVVYGIYNNNACAGTAVTFTGAEFDTCTDLPVWNATTQAAYSVMVTHKHSWKGDTIRTELGDAGSCGQTNAQSFKTHCGACLTVNSDLTFRVICATKTALKAKAPSTPALVKAMGICMLLGFLIFLGFMYFRKNFETENPLLLKPAKPSRVNRDSIIATVLLMASCSLMITAWYLHLKLENLSMVAAIFFSWAIAGGEYILMVPANRIGHRVLTAAELRAIAEFCILTAFLFFSTFVLGEPLKWNHLIGFGMVMFGVYIVLLGPFEKTIYHMSDALPAAAHQRSEKSALASQDGLAESYH